MYKNGGWALADLGFTGPSDKESNAVYGNLAYMAPEVLLRGEYTPAVDIYSAGMLMYQCCSGVPPFYDLDHDSNLMLYICDGIRPTIPEMVPQFYKDIMKQCWDSDPQKRPKSEELYNLFEGRLKESPETINELKTPVFKDFVTADPLENFNNITL
ncbi:18890_t:CDS:1, partial [Racocetra fulgida]